MWTCRTSRIAALLLAAATSLASPVAASQQPTTVRVGYLSPFTPAVDSANREAFLREMQSLGYVEGRNLAFVARHSNGDPAALRQHASSLASDRLDVVLTAATPAARAMREATKTTPIVMAFAGDPVGDGIIASLAHPGGNVTGLSAAVSEIAAKRVELLKSLVPKLEYVLLLATPQTASASMIGGTERTAKQLGARVSTVRAGNAEDIQRAFATLAPGKANGIVVDLLVRQHVAQIVDLAQKHRAASVSGPREFAEAGGLLSYGPSYPDLYRRAATYVDKILRGAKPADLPVEQPTKFEMVVNLRTAKALGIAVPPSLLARADSVIE